MANINNLTARGRHILQSHMASLSAALTGSEGRETLITRVLGIQFSPAETLQTGTSGQPLRRMAAQFELTDSTGAAVCREQGLEAGSEIATIQQQQHAPAGFVQHKIRFWSSVPTVDKPATSIAWIDNQKELDEAALQVQAAYVDQLETDNRTKDDALAQAEGELKSVRDRIAELEQQLQQPGAAPGPDPGPDPAVPAFELVEVALGQADDDQDTNGDDSQDSSRASSPAPSPESSPPHSRAPSPLPRHQAPPDPLNNMPLGAPPNLLNPIPPLGAQAALANNGQLLGDPANNAPLGVGAPPDPLQNGQVLGDPANNGPLNGPQPDPLQNGQLLGDPADPANHPQPLGPQPDPANPAQPPQPPAPPPSPPLAEDFTAHFAGLRGIFEGTADAKPDDTGDREEVIVRRRVFFSLERGAGAPDPQQQPDTRPAPIRGPVTQAPQAAAPQAAPQPRVVVRVLERQLTVVSQIDLSASQPAATAEETRAEMDAINHAKASGATEEAAAAAGATAAKAAAAAAVASIPSLPPWQQDAVIVRAVNQLFYQLTSYSDQLTALQARPTRPGWQETRGIRTKITTTMNSCNNLLEALERTSHGPTLGPIVTLMYREFDRIQGEIGNFNLSRSSTLVTSTGIGHATVLHPGELHIMRPADGIKKEIEKVKNMLKEQLDKSKCKDS